MSALSIQFEKACDVLVCGAGIAGVAAALEAARAGRDTLLVEKTVFAGGLATTGLVNVYLPICDGNGRQVSFGLAEELLHLCNRYGCGTVSGDWRQRKDAAEPQRYRLVFSPAAYVLALDEALEAAGVRMLFDALACRPVIENGRVTGVDIENKSGRGRIRAGCVVDASGDADIAGRAGAPCVTGHNRLSLWAIREDLRPEATTRRRRDDQPDMVCLHHGDSADYRGTDGDDVSRFVHASRKMLREDLAKLYATDPSLRHAVYPLHLPAMAQFRTTRRIEGHETMAPGGDWQARDDAVGLVADWRRPGSVWEVPYGALLPRNIGGLLAAGRCMSSADDAWQVMRVIPAAAVTGQAAGAAAALAAAQKRDPADIPAAEVQRVLAARGIPLHLREIYAAHEWREPSPPLTPA